MNSSEFSTESAAGELRISGTVDTYGAARLREELLRAFAEHAALTVDLSAVEACDFTAIQLLCSARRSAQEVARPFAVTGVSEAVRRACAALGLSPRVFGAEGSD